MSTDFLPHPLGEGRGGGNVQAPARPPPAVRAPACKPGPLGGLAACGSKAPPRPPPSPGGGGGNTRVSVVIPTYRRPALLRRCLEAVLAQQRPAETPFEIIVVDDGHDEATRSAVEALAAGQAQGGPALRYLRPPAGRGPSVARNCGWRAARSALVAFTDDDTIPQPGWLAEGARAMADGRLAAVCGAVRVPTAGPRPTDHERMTQGLETAEFVTANAFVRRDCLARIGGFDERFTRAWREDSDLQFRLLRECGPVGRASAALVLHPVRAEPWGVCLRQQRNTFFDALLYKKHPHLYRQRIRSVPPWNYYLIVALALAVPPLLLAGAGGAALGAALLGALMVLQLAWARLRHTARTPAHVLEMLATSALIPFLSVYWRLRGALHFRAGFL